MDDHHFCEHRAVRKCEAEEKQRDAKLQNATTLGAACVRLFTWQKTLLMASDEPPTGSPRNMRLRRQSKQPIDSILLL